ncbi:MAG: NYN domain-containing protein [Acholeplasmatales bacterium]|jgi:uncharacterized protein (TIGR00288 family)|nr:NYN domain-containing protein [Acholeplasmatales bacterium]
MENKKKIALLIDYDNFNHEKYFNVLFDELNNIGDILIKYAFYSNLSDSTIKKKFIEYGIEPKSQLSYSNGKNAVDISIALEAMELLRSDYIDCFCLATNDSDFTPLVKKLKKYNKFVIGAGDEKASDAFKNACDQFVSVERILNANKPIAVILEPAAAAPKAKKTSGIISASGASLLALVKSIDDIIDSNHDTDGFSDFSWVILTLKNKMKDFNPKNYGASNIQPLPFFENYLKDYYLIEKEGTASYIKKIK